MRRGGLECVAPLNAFVDHKLRVSESTAVHGSLLECLTMAL